MGPKPLPKALSTSAPRLLISNRRCQTMSISGGEMCSEKSRTKEGGEGRKIEEDGANKRERRSDLPETG